MPLIAKGKSTADKPFAEEQEWDHEPNVQWPSVEDEVKAFGFQFQQFIRHRITAVSFQEELDFLHEQLDNPALDDHPKRDWAVRRLSKLHEDQDLALLNLLTANYHMSRSWERLTSAERKRWKLDELIGFDADQESLRTLPTITSGPVQGAAPVPEDWHMPTGLEHRIPPNIALRADLVPF